jgi:hypothetical protein|tara:strand:- start:921 stop:1409 length:489 start_codon:yes stop_codon:yes gene_type:complete
MANLIENDKMFYTNYEPKVQNRFILEVDGLPSYLCKKVSRPQLECGEVVLDHINIIRKMKGKCKWGDITITMYDAIVPSGAQAVMEWVRTSHESVTGRDGYADFYKKDFDIFVLGPVGDKIENWSVKGAYIKTAQFGDMDWSTETPVEIALTLGVDYCVLEY